MQKHPRYVFFNQKINCHPFNLIILSTLKMHRRHLSHNSHIHSFQYSILKNKELKTNCQLLQQLEIKSMNARHHRIMIHHSIHNLNRNMRHVLFFHQESHSCTFNQRVSHSKNVKPTSLLLSKVNWPLSA